MDVKDYLKAEIDRKLAEAEAITNASLKEGRNISDDEKQKVERLVDEAAQLKERVKGMEDTERLRENIESMQGPVNKETTEAPSGTKSVGEAFVKSNAYNALVEGMKSGKLGNIWSSGAVEIPFDAKATVTSTASPIVQPDVQGGMLDYLHRRLTVADLLAQGTTDSSTVRYLREVTNTNAAAFVAEGADKPESTIVFDQVDEPVRKVATFLPVSDEMLEDVAQLRSYLDGRLRLFVQHAEEASILNGNGTAPNLRGLLQRSGIQTATRATLETSSGATNPTAADALFQAIVNVQQNALIEPDGIIIHPTNWAAIRLLKDGNDQYFGGGPLQGQYGNGGIVQNSLWGLPVVVTSAIAQNTALVGAFRTAAQVYRRNNLTVEASNSHSDFFQKNLTAIRAEQRLALAVYRPNAFHAVTALQTPAA
jgi:HK97 family phage major capsid protein